MPAPNLPELYLTGAEVLTPHGVEHAGLSLAGGRIVGQGGRPVDLSGYFALPGIVDLHGDGFERHMAPRRGANESLAAGLTALDAELAANGITTSVLAQFYSWEGGMRGPEFANAVADELARFPALADLRMQLRLETHLIDDYAKVLCLIDRTGIGYVVFNDHLPHDALAAGKRPPRLVGQALKAGRSPEAHWDLLNQLHANHAQVPGALEQLIAALRARDVHLGSHDDHTAAGREWYHGLGVTICEFPETQATAEAAKAQGDAVIMGAPNVVRGGSHDKKVSARTLIDLGLVDALVSDYHYPSLVRAAFRLVDEGVPLQTAWPLISTRPADIMGWTDRGRIALGQRADLVVIEAETRRIECTISGGAITLLRGGLAARVLGV